MSLVRVRFVLFLELGLDSKKRDPYLPPDAVVICDADSVMVCLARVN